MIRNPLGMFSSDGFVVYGGIIGGILAGWIYCKVKKLNFLTCFDLVMPSIALAQGFEESMLSAGAAMERKLKEDVGDFYGFRIST